MDTKTIIGAVVGVIILSAIVIPITDSLSDQITARNNVVVAYTATDVIENTTIEMTESGYKINNYTIPTAQLVGQSRIIIMSDKFVLESGTNPDISMIFTPIDTGVTTSITKLEINESGYTYTPVSGDAVSAQTTIQFLIHPSAKGEFTYVQGTTYIDPNADIYFFSTYQVGSQVEHVIGSGTVADPSTIMESNATDIVTEVQTEGSNPTKLTAVQVSFKVSEQNYLLNAAHVFVPVQYHVDTDNSNIIQTLTALIPVILTVALIIGVVSSAIIKRE